MSCVCNLLPQHCQCHVLPTYEEMVALQAKHGGQRRLARALGVSRPVVVAFLQHYGLTRPGGRPSTARRYALRKLAESRAPRPAVDARELRAEAGWPPLEEWRGELWP